MLLARPSVAPDAVSVTDAVYQALLEAGIPPAEVPRVERLLSTFVIGFAASEINGRFASRQVDAGEAADASNLRDERARVPGTDRPAHHLLVDVLSQPVDWDAEFAADLRDLRAVITALTEGGHES